MTAAAKQPAAHTLTDEYEHCAEMCAARGLRGVPGDHLPALIRPETLDAINSDPEAFERRVRDYAYGQAMAKLNLPEDAQ